MNQTKTMRKQARQGDVFIERVSSAPQKNLQSKRREGGRLILAAGEVTGHHHAISDEHVDLHETAEEAGVNYLEVQQAMAALSHEEHATINIPEGTYKVTIQNEYTPQAIRKTQD